MKLILAIKQKNEELRLKNSEIQQRLHERKTTPECRSFLVTFVFAPLVVGAVVRLVFGEKWNYSQHLARTIFPSMGLLPLFNFFVKREMYR